MNLKPLANLILLLCTCIHLSAVEADSTALRAISYPALGIRLQGGEAIVHTPALKPFKNIYPLGVELDIHWLRSDNTASNLYKCHPKYGATFTYWDFRNPDHFGYAVTGMFTMESYYGLQNRFSFSYKCGLGFSYQNRPYNALKNKENEAISTNVAFPLMLGFGGNMWLNSHFLMNVNANINHISNGGFKAPNLGLNWVTLGMGIDYYFTAPTLQPKQIADWKQLSQPKNRLDLNVYTGFKELTYGDYYSIPGIEIKGSHQFARINAVTLGVEYIYDRAMSDNYRMESTIKNYNKLSAAFGHEFLLGKFSFSQQFGVYVYNPYHGKSDFYQRYGLVYFITPHLNAGINLKSYFEKAQFVDARIGYSFRR